MPPAFRAGLPGSRPASCIGPGSIERAIVVKRCYADPALLAQNGDRFTAAGFTVIECPASVSGTRGADIDIAIDAIDALADPAGYDEFIVLSAEPALAPVLARLHEHDRRTATYADTTTTSAHRALADGVLEVAAFAEFLLTHDGDEAASAAALDRAEIEAFARKIHAATNIPLFSPKTFAELFRFLTSEIAANGYHFQTTAKNVADQLAETGRSVTRRQVVFVVKGLALKGHVFSTSDTPRKLAEVFREQAHYLIGSAGLTLDDNQERLLSAWLVDRVPVDYLRPPLSRPDRPRRQADRAGEAGADQARQHEHRRPPRQRRRARPSPPPSRNLRRRPAAEGGRPPGRWPSKPAAAAPKPPTETQGAAPQSPPRQRAGRTMISPDDARAAIAARVAASVRAKPAAAPNRQATNPPAAEEPAESAETTEPAAEAPEPVKAQSLESSILAAIAEAVDVLVEDSDSKADAAPAPPREETGAGLRRHQSTTQGQTGTGAGGRRATTSATRSSGSSPPTTAPAKRPRAREAAAGGPQPLAMYCPPFADSTAPVMKAASSETR